MTITIYEADPGVKERLHDFNFDCRVSKLSGNLIISISGVAMIQQINDEDITIYKDQYSCFSMEYDEYSEIVVS